MTNTSSARDLRCRICLEDVNPAELLSGASVHLGCSCTDIGILHRACAVSWFHRRAARRRPTGIYPDDAAALVCDVCGARVTAIELPPLSPRPSAQAEADGGGGRGAALQSHRAGWRRGWLRPGPRPPLTLEDAQWGHVSTATMWLFPQSLSAGAAPAFYFVLTIHAKALVSVGLAALLAVCFCAFGCCEGAS